MHATRRGFLGGLTASVIALRTAGAQTPGASDADAWSFTDDRGVTVTLPEQPTRVIAQVNSAATLWDFGVRPVGVFGPQALEDGSKDPLAGNIDLDEITSVGDGWEPIDLERFIALEPDLIVSTTWDPTTPALWGLGDDATIAQAEQIAPTVAISLLDRSIEEVIARFAELANALGADLEAPEVATARAEFAAASADLEQAISEKPGLLVAFIAGSPDNLFAEGARTGPDTRYFTDLGLNIKQADAEPWYLELSWEQVGQLADVDLFLNDAREAAGYFTVEQLLGQPTFAALPAAQAGQIGPWRVEYVMSYQGFTSVLEELAETIRAARDDVA
ncbi:MAG: ABC transporter substrate-binding protein [Thermomicrobiales bacterium]|nr:ABC transporter substrate-binding protein [Thermomicrobiales bacterium]